MRLNWGSWHPVRRSKVSENDGFVGIDDAVETMTFRYQGLWTPTISDSISFQMGLGDSDTTIGPGDYFDRSWDNKYQHFSWKKMANDWSDIELSIYHNAIDFVDEDRAASVEDVLGYWGDRGNGKDQLMAMWLYRLRFKYL